VIRFLPFSGVAPIVQGNDLVLKEDYRDIIAKVILTDV
jgi:hypothetical protein